jgi:uncharacterized membrane protein
MDSNILEGIMWWLVGIVAVLMIGLLAFGFIKGFYKEQEYNLRLKKRQRRYRPTNEAY